MPNLPMVLLEHPIAGTPLNSVLDKVDAAIDEVITKLVTPLPSADTPGKAATPARSEWMEFEALDEWSDLQSEFLARGWGDGLPMVPPTQARVAMMVGGSDLPPEHIVGELAPKMGVATVERIAANAVMAGCRPEYMPVLVALAECS